MDALRETAAEMQKELSEIPADADPSVSSPVVTPASPERSSDAGETPFPANFQRTDVLYSDGSAGIPFSQDELQEGSPLYALKEASMQNPPEADEAKPAPAADDKESDKSDKKEKDVAKDADKSENKKKEGDKDAGKDEAAESEEAKADPPPAKADPPPPAGDPVLVRPTAGGDPEIIEFGLFAKTFYGINLKDNNFVIDVVMTLKWTDKRVAALIPPGLEKLTLSRLDSMKSMWLPQTVITNRDLKKYDLISTAVMINKEGEVFKVERATAIIKDKYMLKHYPYDFQDLVVKIASAKYMIDEVVFKPSTEGVGVAENLFKGYSYDFVSVGASAIRDVDGALKKSRGLLTIRVKRDSASYAQSHLIPCFLTICISCGIHYFPFVAPFITPRVALGVLALLAFTNLVIASNLALPAGAPFNWNDLFNQTVMTLMFTNICMNVFSEVCFHKYNCDDLAKAINMELKVVMPGLCILSATIILSTAGPDGMGLDNCSYFVKIVSGAVMAGYISFCVHRLVQAIEAKAKADAAKAIP